MFKLKTRLMQLEIDLRPLIQLVIALILILS